MSLPNLTGDYKAPRVLNLMPTPKQEEAVPSVSDPPKTLALKANGAVLFPDLEAAEAGLRRFICCSFDHKQGRVLPASGVIVKPMRAEYVQGLISGELLPGDPATSEWLSKQPKR